MQDHFELTDQNKISLESFRRRYHTAVLTLLFTDIVSSTGLKEKLGDEESRRLVLEHDNIVRNLLRKFPEAEEISTSGDSFFLVFLRPSDAVHYALALQKQLREWNQQGVEPVQDRIGIHAGEVVVRKPADGEREVYGLQVDIASRVMSLADGGRILLSSLVFDAAKQTMKDARDAAYFGLTWVRHGRFRLKGISEPLEICEVGETASVHFITPQASDKAIPVDANLDRPRASNVAEKSALTARQKVIAAILGGSLLLACAALLVQFGKKTPTASGEARPSAPTPGTELSLHVVNAEGKPISGANCTLVVGGFPTGDNGYPTNPKPENSLKKATDSAGNVFFRHEGLSRDQRLILYLESADYSGATRFLAPSEPRQNPMTIVLFKRLRANLRYAFQPSGAATLAGDGLLSGKVTLYPMEAGSYRPPARAHFSFKQNKVVSGSGALDVGIALDARDGVLYFGDSKGRFDHCTDVGVVSFDAVNLVDPRKLARVREDTPILQGHTYIYESNIYPPAQRTAFTGLDVYYAKIFVESIEEVPPDEAQ